MSIKSTEDQAKVAEASGPAAADVPEPMRRWERGLAFAVGVTTGGAGVWAVFKSDNQAGTAVLLAMAAALLLVAIQGTPLLGFGSGNNRVDFDRRRRIDRALEAAASEPNPDVAQGIVEGAAIIEPDLTARSQAAPLAYERRVREAVNRIGGRELDGAVAPVDIVASSEDGRGLPIIVKYRSGLLMIRDVMAEEGLARRAGYSGGLLIVTNARLSRQVEDYNAERAGKNPSVEVVRWNGPEDDDLLSRAFGRGAG